MKKDQKFFVGILVSVLILSLFSNRANAITVENNLSTKKPIDSITAKAVFLVSKPKSLVKVEKDLDVLARYQNSTSLTDQDLKKLLYAIGFRGQRLKEAWSIAKKESNGQPIRYNGNSKTGDSSLGLFQINMIRDLGPDRRAKFGLNFSAELLNPVVNAQVAYHMSAGGKNWSSWHGITPRTKVWMKKFDNL
jgi:hypothetical protein